MRITILDAFATDQGDPALWEPVRLLGTAAFHPRTPADQVAARCHGAEAVLTNKAPMPAAVLEAIPGLRYIGVTATGTNIVDVQAAARLGIAVSNVPGYSTESVAQHVFALVLHLCSDAGPLSQAVKAGGWAASPDFCFFRKPLVELAGKTLAVVGMGAIGSACARIARGFGMQAVAAQVPGSSSPGRVPLDQALAGADVVTLHCPLTPATERLADARFLSAMKPGAILVNTGRGALLDDAAVAAALASGRLGGLGLDVLTKEPPNPGHPLLDPGQPWSDRVVVTPHVAWGSVEARRRLVDEVAANLAAFARGEKRNRVA